MSATAVGFFFVNRQLGTVRIICRNCYGPEVELATWTAIPPAIAVETKARCSECEEALI